MSNPQSIVKPSDTATYTGVLNPEPFQNGTLQCAAWADLDTPPYGNNASVLQGVPAASFVTISGQDDRLTQVGTRQQYSLQISLSQDAGGYTLTGGLTTALGGASTPVGDYFYAISRQEQVATVDGLTITPTGRGSTVIEVRWPVGQVNANFTNATSNPTNFAYASIVLTVAA
jgi:hypothetical protein